MGCPACADLPPALRAKAHALVHGATAAGPGEEPVADVTWRRLAPSRRAALRLLLDDGRWHTAEELRRLVGWRYGARLHELRRGEDGGPPLTVEVRGDGGLYRYRKVTP